MVCSKRWGWVALVATAAVLAACGNNNPFSGEDGSSVASDTGSAPPDGFHSDDGGMDGGNPARDDGAAPGDGSDGGGDAADSGCAIGRARCGASCIDVSGDLANCGACGNACAGGDHAMPSCVNAACELRCATGYANCDGTASNGCETELRASVANCGACGTACTSGAHGTAACTGGACTVVCASGFADCNGSAADGCEVDVRTSATDCGACGNACGVGATCSGGTCVLTCAPGFADCDGVASNGCEANLRSSAANCGTCGTACSGATPTCLAGRCAMTATCTVAGTADCDGIGNNGCETTLSSSVGNCGACGNACPTRANTVASCVASRCNEFCSGGYADCNHTLTDGCESATGNDPANCGACGHACAADQLCAAGTCTAQCTLPVRRALVLPNDTVTNGSLTGTSAVGYVCSARTAGPEDIYSLVVTTPTWVKLSTGGTVDTAIAIRSICTAAGTYETGSSCDTDSGPGTLSTLRTRLAAGRYTVVVDQTGATSTVATGGAYTLALSSFTPASNATCTTPTTLATATSLTVQDLSLGGPATSACGGFEGAQLYYAVVVPAGQRTVVTVTPTGASPWQPAVRIAEDCAASCVSSGGALADGGTAIGTYDNRGIADRTVIVAVTSAVGNTEGAFTIAARNEALTTPAVNSTCATGSMVFNGTTVTGESLNGLAATTNTCLPAASGGQLHYAIVLQRGETVHVTATPSAGSTADLVLRGNAAGSCYYPRCDASANANGPGLAESLDVTSTRDNTSVDVAVGATTPESTGTVDLAFTVTPAATNGTCAQARVVTAATTVTGEIPLRGSAFPAYSSCYPTTSGLSSLYYAVTVPAGQRLRVDAVSHAPTSAPVLQVLASCANTTCAAGAAATVGSTAASTRLLDANGGTAAQTVLVALSDVGTQPGPIDVSFAFEALGATNVSCATARTVSGNTTLTGVDTAAGGTPVATCYSGPQLYYQVSIPASSVLRLTVTPRSTTTQPVLSGDRSCRADLCYSSSSVPAPPGAAYTVGFLNTSNYNPLIETIVLGSTSIATAGLVDLSFVITALPPESTCATAPVLATGTPLAVEGLSADEYSDYGCFGAYYAVEYFRVSVPAGRTLRVSASTDSTAATARFAPSVGIASACSYGSCLASTGSRSMASATSYTNSGTSAATYLVQLETSGASHVEADFIDPPAGTYSPSTIAASCDDVSSGTVLLAAGTTGYTGYSVTQSLPFAFTYFGRATSSVAASADGYAQLFSSVYQSDSLNGANTTLPSPTAPQGLVAPYWDALTALVPTGASASAVRAATFGSTGARHYTIEWNGFGSTAPSGSTSQRFQAKFFEGTNAIEFHYCSTNGALAGTGGSATIGLTDLTGTRAVQSSYDLAGSANAGTAIRYTPM